MIYSPSTLHKRYVQMRSVHLHTKDVTNHKYKYIQYKPCAKTLATRRAEGLMILDFQVPWLPWLSLENKLKQLQEAM